MIVVISDLHFEEEASDIICGEDERPPLIFRRNLHPRAYREFIAGVADQARCRRVRNFDLVIAGDLFDFDRTLLWFEDELRPYVSLSSFAPPLEAKLLRILDAIASEPVVKGALDCFQLLSQGRYRPREDDLSSNEELDFPAERISIHYLPGNHDRLANATASVRRRIRALLGLSGDASFDHKILFDDPAALVRHGHEYDPNCFALDISGQANIPLDLPEAAYAEPVFGDFITIDVAVQLPYLFRKKYGDQQIFHDKVLSSLYLRLLQLDDVRPQSALLAYLLDASSGDFTEEQAWERLVPVFEMLLDRIHSDRYFRQWMRQRANSWTPALLDLSRGMLKVGAGGNRIAREFARVLAHHFLGGATERPELVARREDAVKRGAARFVLAGHTHFPQVSLIASDALGDRFYINTGTWRTHIPATPDQRAFGQMKALTYVLLSASNEAPQDAGPNLGCFNYWTAYTSL